MMASVVSGDEKIQPPQSEQRKRGRRNVNERALKHTPRRRDWRKRAHASNDPKLSDGGGCRGPCMAGGKAAAEARALAAVAVRCSAWLAVAVIVMERRSSSER